MKYEYIHTVPCFFLLLVLYIGGCTPPPEKVETTMEIGGYLGRVNIAQFPEHVRNTLRNLRINRYTQPIKVGDTYVIYKRLEDHRQDQKGKKDHCSRRWYITLDFNPF